MLQLSPPVSDSQSSYRRPFSPDCPRSTIIFPDVFDSKRNCSIQAVFGSEYTGRLRQVLPPSEVMRKNGSRASGRKICPLPQPASKSRNLIAVSAPPGIRACPSFHVLPLSSLTNNTEVSVSA